MRLVLTLLLAGLLPVGLLAAKGKGNPHPKPNPKPNNAAQIQALEQHKKQLQMEEKAQLQHIEVQLKAGLAHLHQQKGQHEKVVRQQIETEKQQTLKRIDERFAYVRQHQKPYQVWGQLEHGLQVVRGVVNHLENANSDYGGNKKAALQSLKAAAHSLEHRLKVHRWTAAEKQKTVQELQVAETDLQKALAYAAVKYGTGTPKGSRESQAKSNDQLVGAMTVLENVRHLVLHAQWEEGADHNWAEQLKKNEQAEKHQIAASFDARLKNIDKEVTQHIQQQTKLLEQHKHQAIAEVKAHYKAAIQAVDNQIRQMRK